MAYLDTARYAFLEDFATSNDAGVMLEGYREWWPELYNDSAASVTDPTVTVDSGYPASRFYWGGPVAALPVSRTQSTLAPGEAMPGGWLDSDLTTTFEAGFDSTRQVDTSVIPSGGGTQTVTVTVTPRDGRRETLPGHFEIWMWTDQPGVSLASASGPANLDEGEVVETYTPPGDLVLWTLAGDRPRVGKTYTFNAVLQVDNSWGADIEFRPHLSVLSDLTVDESPSGPSASVSIAAPTLDGATAGRGQVVFAVQESGHGWTLIQDEGREVNYLGTPAVTPPSAPRSVSAVPASGSAVVRWAAPADSGGLPLTRYVASAFSAATGGQFRGACGTTGATSCTIPGLANGTTYWIAVKARNGMGDSAYSTPRVAVIPRPTVKVKVAKAGYGNQLYVNVDPNRGAGYWTFRVQKRTATGAWTTLPTVYRTLGAAETRTLTLGAGTFRVRVAAKYGYLGATSAAVVLTKPTVRVRLTTDRVRDRLFVDVDPNKGTGYWTFRVQKRTATGSWRTLATTYRTLGSAETRTVDLPAGVYRVVVAPKYLFLGATSRAVTLVR